MRTFAIAAALSLLTLAPGLTHAAAAADSCAQTTIAATTPAAKFTGSPHEWSLVADAIANANWASAKATFDRNSTYRGQSQNGIHEPMDTDFRRGEFQAAFQALYRAAICGPTVMTPLSAAVQDAAALRDAAAGNYTGAKGEFDALVASYPAAGQAWIADGMLALVLGQRTAAVSAWQHAVALSRSAADHAPSLDSVEAAELLLFNGQGLAGANAHLADAHSTLGGSTLGSSSQYRVVAMAARPSPSPTAAIPTFDVIGSWSDRAAPTISGQSGNLYVHVRIYLHPDRPVKVVSASFHISGLLDGRAQTYTAVSGIAPNVAETSYSLNPGLQASTVPSVAQSEDLGAMQPLTLGPGEGKTVVVTFAVPSGVEIDRDRLVYVP